MLDWLIIGGGIHGTHLSLVLTRFGGIPRDRVAVLDPHAEPLAHWGRLTQRTGMTHLRSPHVHNLDVDPWSISTFTKTRAGQPLADFIPTHNRPSLALFRAHNDWLIERHKLAALRIIGRAERLVRLGQGWRVETADGSLDARRVILAIGVTEQPIYPAWAQPLYDADAAVAHIFDERFDKVTADGWHHLVIIGGGITAAQTALTLAARQPGTVTLLMRHPVRVHDFDSDTSWINGESLRGFLAEPDFDRRRALIRSARHRGSMPADVAASLHSAVHAGYLHLVQGEAKRAEMMSGHLCLHLDDDTSIRADRLIFATGFDPRRPGAAWLDAAVDDYQLPVAACGYPLVDKRLAWAAGLYVSGALAELELGAPARNIIGARFAGERIASALP